MVTLLHRMPIFHWYMVMLVVKKGYQNGTCCNDTGLCAQTRDIIISSINNTFARTCALNKHLRNTSYILMSYIFCILIFILKSKQQVMWFTITSWMRWFPTQSNEHVFFDVGSAHNRATNLVLLSTSYLQTTCLTTLPFDRY